MDPTHTDRKGGPAHAIGIDIGGTKTALALVDASGRIADREVLATEAEQGFDRATERMAAAIEALLARSGQPAVVGIGIGCAGPLDSMRGLINNPYTLAGWNRCDIVTPLQRRFGVPAFLENDADVAVLGEWACGVGRGFDPVVMLTFGTGIGGAAVVRGEIYRGANGEHPELGHVWVSGDGPDCYCGVAGCLESIASGTAIAAAGKAAGFAGTREVFAAFRSGNPAAQTIIQKALRAASAAAWTICHTLLPQRLILGGGMMDDHYELFAQEIRERLGRATQFSPSGVSLARAALGNEAGIVGAATMAIRRANQAGGSPLPR